jgi:hypothetical protein
MCKPKPQRTRRTLSGAQHSIGVFLSCKNGCEGSAPDECVRGYVIFGILTPDAAIEV